MHMHINIQHNCRFSYPIPTLYTDSNYVYCTVQADAPLAIRPMLPHLTKSEIHAVMTGGFATIAGSVMAVYILLNVSVAQTVCL